MRFGLIAALALAWAGCIDLSDDATEDDASFRPLSLGGEWWVPADTDTAPAVLEVPFPVNATGRHTRAQATLAELVGGEQITGSTAPMRIRLFDAHDALVAEDAREPMAQMTLNVDQEDLPVGEAKLVIEVTGTSDGSANGDRVTWLVEVK